MNLKDSIWTFPNLWVKVTTGKTIKSIFLESIIAAGISSESEYRVLRVWLPGVCWDWDWSPLGPTVQAIYRITVLLSSWADLRSNAVNRLNIFTAAHGIQISIHLKCNLSICHCELSYSKIDNTFLSIQHFRNFVIHLWQSMSHHWTSSCQLSLIIMMLFWYWNLMIDKSCGYLQSAISLNCFVSHKWEVVDKRDCFCSCSTLLRVSVVCADCCWDWGDHNKGQWAGTNYTFTRRAEQSGAAAGNMCHQHHEVASIVLLHSHYFRCIPFKFSCHSMLR